MLYAGTIGHGVIALNAEASTLGWRAGEWPEIWETPAGMRFWRATEMKMDGELLGWKYTTPNGTVHLTVFND